MVITRREALRLGLAGAGAVAAAGAFRLADLASRGARPYSAVLLAAPGLSIVPRSGWAADEALRRQSPLFAPIRQLFVHHTVTANGAAPVPTIQSIYQAHLANGWNDIGYNFLIDAGGTIWEGRYSRPYPAGQPPTGQDAAGMGVVGAHVTGHDVGSVGVALLGTFLSVPPTDAAFNSLMELLAWLTDLYGLDPMGSTGGEPVIAGHRDANVTACPGDDCYDHLPAIRQEVAARIQANAGKPPMTPPSCTLVVPGGISATATPLVTGQVSRSAAGVNVTFTGASGAHAVVASLSGGGFSVPASAYGLGLFGLPADTYTVAAVAVDAVGNASGPTTVASGLRVSPGANLPAGYWILGDDGGVFAYGQASFLGSTGGEPLNAPVVGFEATPDGRGYWLVAADGGIFAYGSAGFFGSTGSLRLNKPIVGITRSPSGNGYRLVASDGGIFSFGDAPFFGSTGSLRLNQPIIGMAATPSGNGYWLAASDGGMFAFGDAGFHGSAAGRGASAPPIVGMAPTPSGQGYWLADSNGGVYPFGDAGDFGSVPASGLTDTGIAGLTAVASGNGYYLVNSSGKVYPFGAAPSFGDALSSGLTIGAIGLAVDA
jgi:hypothetical protein